MISNAVISFASALATHGAASEPAVTAALAARNLRLDKFPDITISSWFDWSVHPGTADDFQPRQPSGVLLPPLDCVDWFPNDACERPGDRHLRSNTPRSVA
ncbi:exported hypothetical protein [Mesorhizobium plurifarium]|uniref:Uncharacterized protein n=1 Tax=Mesorhizobium plurifarium TaxID=69974 RepID=A0A090G7U7_MESPL|nr:exported hypothetical protein [Mesorhizobium plurifarium]